MATVQKKIREIFRNYAKFISHVHLERAHRRRLERGGPFKKNLEADLTKMLSMKKCTNQGFLLVQGGALETLAKASWKVSLVTFCTYFKTKNIHFWFLKKFLLQHPCLFRFSNNQRYLQLAAVSSCLCHSKKDADWLLDPKTDWKLFRLELFRVEEVNAKLLHFISFYRL